MGVNNETLYLKIEQNTIVFDRHVVLNDIAKMAEEFKKIIPVFEQLGVSAKEVIK